MTRKSPSFKGGWGVIPNAESVGDPGPRFQPGRPDCTQMNQSTASLARNHQRPPLRWTNRTLSTKSVPHRLQSDRLFHAAARSPIPRVGSCRWRSQRPDHSAVAAQLTAELTPVRSRRTASAAQVQKGMRTPCRPPDPMAPTAGESVQPRSPGFKQELKAPFRQGMADARDGQHHRATAQVASPVGSS